MTEFSSNGTTITLKKSIRREMHYKRLRDVLAQDESLEDHNERFQFAYVSAFVDTVDGMDWTPPKFDDSPAKIEKSYYAFLDADIDYAFFNGLSDAVTALRAPTSSPVHKPDEALTAEEKADPNS
jgi:hypothetical protein